MKGYDNLCEQPDRSYETCVVRPHKDKHMAPSQERMNYDVEIADLESTWKMKEAKFEQWQREMSLLAVENEK